MYSYDVHVAHMCGSIPVDTLNSKTKQDSEKSQYFMLIWIDCDLICATTSLPAVLIAGLVCLIVGVTGCGHCFQNDGCLVEAGCLESFLQCLSLGESLGETSIAQGAPGPHSKNTLTKAGSRQCCNRGA